MKLFKTKPAAVAAVKKQKIDGIPHEVKYMDAANSGYYVEFTVDNKEDFDELMNRGFKAKIVK